MRKYEILLYIVLMFFLAACEKPLYDDEIEPEEQELTEKDDDNDKTDDDGSNKDDNDDSDSKDDEGEEVEVDPDDIPESYEETDIVDDNDNDNNKGRTLEDALTVDEFINGDGYAGQVYVVYSHTSCRQERRKQQGKSHKHTAEERKDKRYVQSCRTSGKLRTQGLFLRNKECLSWNIWHERPYWNIRFCQIAAYIVRQTNRKTKSEASRSRSLH